MDKGRKLVGNNWISIGCRNAASKKFKRCAPEDKRKTLNVIRKHVVSLNECLNSDQRLNAENPAISEVSAKFSNSCGLNNKNTLVKHHTPIIKALTNLRTVAHKNFCHISKTNIPYRHKVNLTNMFSTFIIEVNQYKEQLTIYADEGIKTASKHLYVKLHLLQARLNEYLQRYIGILSESKKTEHLYDNFLTCFSWYITIQFIITIVFNL